MKWFSSLLSFLKEFCLNLPDTLKTNFQGKVSHRKCGFQAKNHRHLQETQHVMHEKIFFEGDPGGLARRRRYMRASAKSDDVPAENMRNAPFLVCIPRRTRETQHFSYDSAKANE